MNSTATSPALSPLEQLQGALDGIASLRTRVVWLVGRPGTGKTKLLHDLARSRPDCEYVNVSLQLAKALVERPPASRPFDAPASLSAVLPARRAGAWLADNTELPLSRELQLAVVERFKAIGQHVPLVVAWCGDHRNNRLVYGTPEHPDYREFVLDSPLVVDLNNTQNANTQGH